jgi:hypothetical protein
MMYRIIQVGFPVQGQDRVRKDTGCFYAPLVGTVPTVGDAIKGRETLEKLATAGWTFELEEVTAQPGA